MKRVPLDDYGTDNIVHKETRFNLKYYKLIKFFLFVVFMFIILFLLSQLSISYSKQKAPGIYINGSSFYTKNGNKIGFLTGMNIMVKGPPWIPDSFSNKRCDNSFCRSFSQADIDHLKNSSYPIPFNAIRLSTIWAGAQPVHTITGLDIEFKERLLNITKLCHKNDIYILLDIHQDALSSVYCGEGVPHWIFEKTVYFSEKPFECKEGLCSCNESEWAEYQGLPDFNILNKCCVKANRDSIWSTNLILPKLLGGYGLVQDELYSKLIKTIYNFNVQLYNQN